MALIDALDTRSIEYGLCGGLAMAVHGYVRATVDIDLLIMAEDVQNAIEVADDLGFDLRAGTMTLGKGAVRIHRVTKVDPQDGDTLWIDLLEVTDSLKAIWNDRINLVWQERDVTVLSKQALIDLKSLRASKQDMADIGFLKGEDNAD